MSSLGQKIRELREKRCLDQVTLAAKIGVTQSYISAIEIGKSTPSLQVLQKIAQALGVVDNNFFFEKQDEINVPVTDLLGHYNKEEVEFLQKDEAHGFVTFVKEMYEQGLSSDDLKALLNILKRRK